MVFDTAAGLGLATSADGRTWRSSEAPWLTAEASEGELTPPRAPTLVVRRDDSLIIAYESAGAIWLADGAAPTRPGPSVGSTRTSARPAGSHCWPLATTPATLGWWATRRAPWAIPRCARRTASPVAPYTGPFSARSAPFALDGGSDFQRAVGLAGSFDAVHFTRSEAAVLGSRLDLSVAAPSAWSHGSLRTWLFVNGRCDSNGRNQGIRVAVAPGNRRYPRTP